MKKQIDARGIPKTGTGPKGGTPGWVKAATNAAERQQTFNHSEHRDRGHQAGTGGIRKGLFGETEKIRPGQGGS